MDPGAPSRQTSAGRLHPEECEVHVAFSSLHVFAFELDTQVLLDRR
jgi:hypothetical protein